MNHVLSVKEFFNQDDTQILAPIREAFLKMPWEALDRIPAFSFPGKELSESEQDRVDDHQVYLLSAFPSIQVITVNENRLLQAGYSTVALTESKTYEATLASLKVVNENLITSIWSFLKKMTNSEDGFNPLGVFQFFLDIVGLIPASLVGIPTDIVANLLNASIYFYNNEYLMGLINLVAVIPTGAMFAAPLKIAGKTFGKALAKIGSLLVKAGGGTAAANVAKTQIKNPSVIKMLGNMLATVAKWIGQTGAKLMKSIVPAVINAVKKITGGAVDLTKYSTKLVSAFDNMAAKLTTLGKEADIASKELLSGKAAIGAEKTVQKAATDVGQAAVDQAALKAKQAGRTLNKSQAAMSRTSAEQGILKKAGNIADFQTEVMANSAAKFDKLFPNVTNKAVRDNWIINDAAKDLVANVLSKKTGLLSITKNKKLMQTLASGKTWKGADKMLANAIKKGSPEELGKVMEKMVADPAFFKLISKNSPEIAKTLTLFKEVPEALIKGADTFKSFSGKALKFGSLYHIGFVKSRLPIFLLKSLLKGTDCGKYVSSADSLGDAASTAGQVGLNKVTQAVSEILSTVPILEQDETVISQEALNQLKTSDPATYQKIIAAQQEADRAANELKQKTDSKNPCLDLSTVKSSQVGAIIDTNNMAWKKGTVETPLRNQEEWERSNLNNYTKGVLSVLKQDTNIDAQKPLASESPVVKAYFSDIVTYEGEIDPNAEPTSRLDATIAKMVAAGELTEAEVPAFKQKVLEHWKNNTMPPEVINASEPPPQANESFLKIGKLTTIR